MYLRLGKAGEPVITANATTPFEFGKLRMLREGTDVCILGYGPILKMAMDAADRLGQRGVSTGVASVHTLKPLDQEGIARVLGKYRHVIVLEEMVAQGGLGESVKAVAWESGATCKIDCMSLKDEFIHVYGKHEDVLAAHGLTLDRLLGFVPG